MVHAKLDKNLTLLSFLNLELSNEKELVLRVVSQPSSGNKPREKSLKNKKENIQNSSSSHNFKED